MPRPRTRDRIQDCAKIPVTWFSPLDDGRLVCWKKEVWVPGGGFSLDFYWSLAGPPGKTAVANCWYDIFSRDYSHVRVVTPRDFHADADAPLGDRRRYQLRLTLAGQVTKLGPTVWHLLCPKCGARRKALFISPQGGAPACRECHPLRYDSQDGEAQRASESVALQELAGLIAQERALVALATQRALSTPERAVKLFNDRFGQ